MGAYLYRVTSKTIDTPVGPANLAKYAYKPFWITSDEAEKRNNRMHRDSGCYASERMIKNGNHTGLVALLDETGDVYKVIVTGDRATFFDDYQDEAKVAWDRDVPLVSKSGKSLADDACMEITGKTWDEYKDTIKGDYTPSVDRSKFSKVSVIFFDALFFDKFGREVHFYG